MTALRTRAALGVGALVALCLAGCQAGSVGPGSVRTSATVTSAAAPPPERSAPPATGAGTPSPVSAAPRPAATAVNPARLSDESMVGQLFIGYVYGSTAAAASPAQRAANLALYGVATPAEVVRRWHLGGVILLDHNNLDPQRPDLSTGNVDSAGQIAGLTGALQSAAAADTGHPLLIGTDQEGGPVQRITDGVTQRPAQLALAHSDPAALQCGYRTLGRQLRALGINQDYAPVADVVRTSGGVIGDRSFGPDPALDSRDVLAAVAGLQDAGVLATLKHWPGHGSTSTDSHAALAVIHESLAQWQQVDRPTFAAAAGVAASMMVGHLALPALDPSGTPATLSGVLVNRALRRDLGFAGLVLTDSLWMEPMQAAGTPGQVAVWAVQAGDDMLLMSPDVPSAYRQVLATVRSDPGFRAQVRTAVGRILAAKAKVSAAVPSGSPC